MKEKRPIQDLVEELFQGEGALPRPPREEMEGLLEALQAVSRVPNPEPSSRVLEEVKHFLHHQKRMHQAHRAPWRASLSMETFRAALRESWLVKGLAAAILVQVLALPILGAMSLWRNTGRGGRTTRTGVDIQEMIQRILPAGEKVRHEAAPGALGIDIQNFGNAGTSGETDPERSTSSRTHYREWLVRENQLREKWLFFSSRRSSRPGKGLPPGPRRSRTLDTRLTALSREIAAHLREERNPLDLALGLRALFLAGNTEVDGPFAQAVRKAFPRLLKAWKKAGPAARIEIAALLGEMEILDGGDRRAEVRRVFRWLVETLSQGDGFTSLPSWALADAAVLLEWAPILVNRNLSEARERVRKELMRRMREGGPEKAQAAAALLRAFPDSAPEEVLLAGTGLPGKGKLELAMEDPFLLLQVSWAPAGSSLERKRLLRKMEEAVLQEVPAAGFREKALRLLTLGACYAPRNR